MTNPYPTDGTDNWFLYLIARLVGWGCPSALAGEDAKCSKHAFHAGRHRDAVLDLSWYFGDEEHKCTGGLCQK